jgi:hypothetical protein
VGPVPRARQGRERVRPAAAWYLFSEGRELLWWYIEEIRGLFTDDPEHPEAPLWPSERLPAAVEVLNLPVGPAVLPSTFRKALQAAASEHLPGPVRDLYPRLLRHARATHNYEAGMSLWEVQKLLGHSWTTTTVRYITELSGIASAGREIAGQQVMELPERRSARPDASPVTWEDPAVIPSGA